MARDLTRLVLCAAEGCTKTATTPKNRSRPNGWAPAYYLVNKGDGRTAIPWKADRASGWVLICPACQRRQEAAQAAFALAQAQEKLQAGEKAQRAAQEAQEAAAEAARKAETARRAERAPEGFQSWAPEVIADSSDVWCGNALRFATRGEAEDNVSDLSWRWFAVRETRVVPSKDPVNYDYTHRQLVSVGEGH